MTDTKTCDHCGETFGRTPKLGASQWQARRFCSPRCAALANQNGTKRPRGTNTTQSKQCVRCGAVYFRKSQGGVAWKARRYCGHACAGVDRRRPVAAKRKRSEAQAEQKRRVSESTWGAAKAVAAAKRIARLPKGPVEEPEDWLARGGQITRVPAASADGIWVQSFSARSKLRGAKIGDGAGRCR